MINAVSMLQRHKNGVFAQKNGIYGGFT